MTRIIANGYELNDKENIMNAARLKLRIVKTI